jgi:hypothetical protein
MKKPRVRTVLSRPSLPPDVPRTPGTSNLGQCAFLGGGWRRPNEGNAERECCSAQHLRADASCRALSRASAAMRWLVPVPLIMAWWRCAVAGA